VVCADVVPETDNVVRMTESNDNLNGVPTALRPL